MKYSKERPEALLPISRVAARAAISRTMPWPAFSKSVVKGLPCVPTAPGLGTTCFGHCTTSTEAVTQQWFLETVEMALAFIDHITRAAEQNALRTGVVCTPFALHVLARLIRLQRCVQMLLHQLPRWLDSNHHELNFVASHAVASVRNPVPSMAQHANGLRLE